MIILPSSSSSRIFVCLCMRVCMGGCLSVLPSISSPNLSMSFCDYGSACRCVCVGVGVDTHAHARTKHNHFF